MRCDFDVVWTSQMSRFWSRLTHDLRPYVPGEQPHMQDLVKLNTNESLLGPSPRVLEAIRGHRVARGFGCLPSGGTRAGIRG
jgi:histidinol-phosphate/aromatic aminotransferase/cobyric acid decarboxylase-like protein